MQNSEENFESPEQLVKQTIELISLPDVYLRLRSVINTPGSSMSDIAQVIAHDPAITARLLKLVNSPFFGLAVKVDTMTHAINMLGTEQVHDLVLATVVVDSFSGFTNDIFNIYDFWFNGVYCAVSARLLAYYCDDLETERPFIAGLLHNIGHLVMYQLMPQRGKATIDLAEKNDMMLYEAERELLGFDYGQVGAALMREWGFPESLQQITEYHNEPCKATDYAVEASVIHIASTISRAVIAEKPISEALQDINPECWNVTSLHMDDMEAMKFEVDQQVSSVMSLIFGRRKTA